MLHYDYLKEPTKAGNDEKMAIGDEISGHLTTARTERESILQFILSPLDVTLTDSLKCVCVCVRERPYYDVIIKALLFHVPVNMYQQNKDLLVIVQIRCHRVHHTEVLHNPGHCKHQMSVLEGVLNVEQDIKGLRNLKKIKILKCYKC